MYFRLQKIYIFSVRTTFPKQFGLHEVFVARQLLTTREIEGLEKPEDLFVLLEQRNELGNDKSIFCYCTISES